MREIPAWCNASLKFRQRVAKLDTHDDYQELMWAQQLMAAAYHWNPVGMSINTYTASNDALFELACNYEAVFSAMDEAEHAAGRIRRGRMPA